MKRRAQKILNFFAFNLLFFALYLNFIHKDKTESAPTASQSSAAAFNGTMPVQNSEKYLNKQNEVTVQQPVAGKPEQENAATLKLATN